MEVKISICNTLSSTTATTVSTKHGGSIRLLLNTEDNHSRTMSSSRSDQEWPETELFITITNTLEVTNTNFSSEIASQEKTDNGSSSIAELDQSELTPGETTPFPTRSVKSSSLESKLSSEYGKTNISKESHTTQEDTETLETMPDTALMSTETRTETTKSLPSGSATMVQTNPGGSTENHSHIQDTHSEMESSSRLSQG